MFKYPFTLYLKERREELNLSQREAALAAGIKAHRWPKLEQGRAVPTEHDLQMIAKLFKTQAAKLHSFHLRPKAAIADLRDASKRWHPSPPVYLPSRDRPNFVRYRAAGDRFSPLVSAMTSRLRERANFAQIAFFCEIVSLGSADECLFLLLLLVRGAQPALTIPTSLGHFGQPLVVPKGRTYVGNRPFPSLLLKSETYFFQVSLATPKVYTVDCLVWDGAEWRVIEIDGPGHNSGYDAARTAALALQVDRLSTNDLVAECRAALGWKPLGQTG